MFSLRVLRPSMCASNCGLNGCNYKSMILHDDVMCVDVFMLDAYKGTYCNAIGMRFEGWETTLCVSHSLSSPNNDVNEQVTT